MTLAAFPDMGGRVSSLPMAVPGPLPFRGAVHDAGDQCDGIRPGRQSPRGAAWEVLGGFPSFGLPSPPPQHGAAASQHDKSEEGIADPV